jgi:uncharacterized membrane protein
MNTVFKFYYQGWILFGIAGAYAAYRVTAALWNSSRVYGAVWIGGLGLALAGAGQYAVLGTASFYESQAAFPPKFTVNSLDGSQFLKESDPSDFRAIPWIQKHISGRPTILEAPGGDFTTFGRVSEFTGLPTLLGWVGHEQQWRGDSPGIATRQTSVNHIYSTGDPKLAERLLATNHVSLVYVGPCEELLYGSSYSLADQACQTNPAVVPVSSAPNALTKFGTFMKLVYDEAGVRIYEMR